MDPFQELLYNTDIVITAGPIASDLAGCLPSNNVPLELSLGNRPILWHVLLPLIDAGGHYFFICVAADWQSVVKESLDAFAAHYSLSKERATFSFVVVDEADVRSTASVAQVVEYAKHHRNTDSIRDFLVVHFDTILNPLTILTFLQGFQTNFVSASVMYNERGLKDSVTDYICIDDSSSHGAPVTAASGACFAEHRRLHLSEPMPCDPDHDLKSSMLMRRPEIVFSKQFKQLPVFLFRPWVAPALLLHYERAAAANNAGGNPNSQQQQQQQQRGATQSPTTPAEPTSGGTSGGSTPASLGQSPSQRGASAGGAGGGGGAEGGQSTSGGGGSNNPNQQQQQRGGEGGAAAGGGSDSPQVQQLMKLREDLIPSLLLCQYSSFVAELQADAAADSGDDKQQQKKKRGGGKLQLKVITSSDRLREELSLPTSTRHQGRNFTVPPHWCLDNPKSLKHPLTLETLNAMTKNLASPHDTVRVFATLCRRSDVPCEFPEVHTIDSAAAYDAAASLLREGLAVPPPPLFTSIQKFAVPDLHASTLALLSAGGTAAEAPANLIRCGLLTVPPPTGCRVERCIVGRDVKFGEKCNVFDSIIMDGADIGSGVVLRRCVVGPRCTVKPNTTNANLILSWAGAEDITKGQK